MSHFTVLVIGPDPEKQLAPYHEFECTGEDDEYIQDIDITEKVQKDIDEKGLEDGLSWHGLEERIVESELDVDKEDKHKYGYAVVKDGKLIKAIDRTNPNPKWDWYELGGRWCGFFKLKHPNSEATLGRPGVFGNNPEHDCDQATKGQIDFEGMINHAKEEAKERYEKVEKAFDGNIPKLEIFWKKDIWDGGKYEKLDIEEKRKLYHEQPGMKLYEKKKEAAWKLDKNDPLRSLLIWLDLEDYQCSKEEYIEEAGNNALTTFAVVKDGKWYERGEMGWWACVSNEKDKKEWNNQFNSLLQDLPDDTLLSLYDCHI